MKLTTIANGYQPWLNPSATDCGNGNTVARVTDLASGALQDFGPYAAAGWRDNDWMGVRSFTEAFKLVNVHTGAVEVQPGYPFATAAQILVTTDGAVWDTKAGIFNRNKVRLAPNHLLAGDLSGQVLSNDGLFFSAEVINDNYHTAVFDNTGNEWFRINSKAINAQVFSHEGYPILFVTEGDQAVFYNPWGRYVVASDVLCYRGSMFAVNGELWALTFSILNGITYGFARPWQDTLGIRVDMWGGLAVARCANGTMMTFAGYNQDTGELVCCDQVPVNSARKPITEEPDYGGGPVTPPVTPPATDFVVNVPAGTKRLIVNLL